MVFEYIEPTDEQKQIMQVFRDAFERLRNNIRDLVPDSRGQSLAFTKLEEASFWTNKAITRND